MSDLVREIATGLDATEIALGYFAWDVVPGTAQKCWVVAKSTDMAMLVEDDKLGYLWPSKPGTDDPDNRSVVLPRWWTPRTPAAWCVVLRDDAHDQDLSYYQASLACARYPTRGEADSAIHLAEMKALIGPASLVCEALGVNLDTGAEVPLSCPLCFHGKNDPCGDDIVREVIEDGCCGACADGLLETPETYGLSAAQARQYVPDVFPSTLGSSSVRPVSLRSQTL